MWRMLLICSFREGRHALDRQSVGFSEGLAKPKSNAITSVLAPHGYALYADTFVNTIYIDTKRTGAVAL